MDHSCQNRSISFAASARSRGSCGIFPSSSTQLCHDLLIFSTAPKLPTCFTPQNTPRTGFTPALSSPVSASAPPSLASSYTPGNRYAPVIRYVFKALTFTNQQLQHLLSRIGRSLQQERALLFTQVRFYNNEPQR
eukprot:Gb_40192 [translate_table: standard]